MARSSRRVSAQPKRLAGACLSEQVLQDKHGVGRSLRETPHQVWIPLRAKRNVNPATPALFDQLQLQIAPHTVKHLEFKGGSGDFFFLAVCDRRADHPLIMRSDTVIRTALE